MAVYCVRAEVKQAIQKTDDDDDALLDSLIEDASRAIDNYCKRPDGFVALATATAREYVGSGTYAQQIDECAAVSKVEVKDSVTDDDYTLWASTDWRAAAGSVHNPLLNRLPYTLLLCAPGGQYAHFTSGWLGAEPRGWASDPPSGTAGPTVRVTAKWGYAVTVPGPIRRATVMQVARWYKRLQSGMTDTLASPEMGGVMLYQSVLDPAITWILDRGGLVRVSRGMG